MDLLKKNMTDKDFQIKITKEIQTLFNNTIGTAELIEIPQGALLILKIPIHKNILKDTEEIIKRNST